MPLSFDIQEVFKKGRQKNEEGKHLRLVIGSRETAGKQKSLKPVSKERRVERKGPKQNSREDTTIFQG